MPATRGFWVRRAGESFAAKGTIYLAAMSAFMVLIALVVSVKMPAAGCLAAPVPLRVHAPAYWRSPDEMSSLWIRNLEQR